MPRLIHKRWCDRKGFRSYIFHCWNFCCSFDQVYTDDCLGGFMMFAETGLLSSSVASGSSDTASNYTGIDHFSTDITLCSYCDTMDIQESANNPAETHISVITQDVRERSTSGPPRSRPYQRQPPSLQSSSTTRKRDPPSRPPTPDPPTPLLPVPQPDPNWG